MSLLTHKIEICIDPVPKPRMTSADRWKHRPIVDRYFGFKDNILMICNGMRFVLADKYKVIFYIAMPKSWSIWKKNDMLGKPHQQKPDLDNLVKSINDCLKVEDKTIYEIQASKFWAEKGKIIIETLD